MGSLISLPNYYKNPNTSPSSWPGTTTSANFSRSNSMHLSGNTTTDNRTQQTLGENVDTGRSNSLYTSSDGLYANVSTKTKNNFYSKHFIGHQNGNSIRSGSSISTSTQSTWLQDVVGFHCEISSRPGGSGDAADGCGQVQQWRIAGVYADQNNKCRIMEMTKGGQKLSSHSYNSYPGQDWKVLSYSLNQNDSLTVVNNKWLLYGWIIEYFHYKHCGGGTKTKNCSGRTRYLRPLISATGYDGLKTSYDHSMLVYHWETTLSTARGSGAKMLQVV